MADDYLDDEDTEGQSPNPRDLRYQLREKNRLLQEAQAEAARTKELEQQIADLQRRNVARDAGVSLTDKQWLALQAAHDGEWTPDSVKQTAAEIFGAPTPRQDPSLDQIDRFTAASAGTEPDRQLTEDEFDAKLRACKTEAEFDALYRTSGRQIHSQG